VSVYPLYAIATAVGSGQDIGEYFLAIEHEPGRLGWELYKRRRWESLARYSFPEKAVRVVAQQ